jgi:DNA-binding transcriptional ArsR family regulator
MAREQTIWRAMASADRRKILELLRRRPRTAGELAAAFPQLSRPAVARHVRLLADSGLVAIRKDGRQMIHSYTPARLNAVLQRWLDADLSE